MDFLLHKWYKAEEMWYKAEEMWLWNTEAIGLFVGKTGWQAHKRTKQAALHFVKALDTDVTENVAYMKDGAHRPLIF